MIKVVEATGRTTEEAVAAALEQLSDINSSLTQSDVQVELLEKAKAGFFGIGSTPAKVRVTYTLTTDERAKDFLEGLLEHMGVEGKVEATMTSDDTLEMNITGENMGVVIGRRGDTLDALQYITSIAVNRDEDTHIRVSLDTENYRKKRQESLEKLAVKVADRVLKYKRSVTLEPMSSYERRVIHSTLQSYNGVSTYSMGSEPNRKVVIAMAGAGKGGRKRQRKAVKEEE